MARLVAPRQLKRTIAVNGDIMIRSLALIAVFVWFMSQGARQGDVVLAANSVLMQFITVAAFFLDGLAFATEALVGRAVGSAHRAGLTAAARMTTLWAAGVATLISLALALFGAQLIDWLTVDAATRATARAYLPWAAAAPLLGVWAYQLDGIFIGATRTADMRKAMLASLAIFLAAWWLLKSAGQSRAVGGVLRPLRRAHRYPALLLPPAGADRRGLKRARGHYCRRARSAADCATRLE
jgi:MATE family multidrug resistance protein